MTSTKHPAPSVFAAEEAHFRAAEKAAESLSKSIKEADRLRLYAMHQQATVGPAPPQYLGHSLDLNARKKWAAWRNLRGITMQEAQGLFVQRVLILNPTLSLARALSGSKLAIPLPVPAIAKPAPARLAELRRRFGDETVVGDVTARCETSPQASSSVSEAFNTIEMDAPEIAAVLNDERFPLHARASVGAMLGYSEAVIRRWQGAAAAGGSPPALFYTALFYTVHAAQRALEDWV